MLRTLSASNSCARTDWAPAEPAEDALAEQHPVRLNWNLTPAQLDVLANAGIAKSKAAVERVVAAHTSRSALTYANCIKPLTEADADFSLVRSQVDFFSYVSTDSAMRDASDDAITKCEQYLAEEDSRKDLFEAVSAFAESDEAKALTGEQERYVDVTHMRDFRRKGMHLHEAAVKKVTEITEQLSTLRSEYEKNRREDETALFLTVQELHGCGTSFLNSHKQPDGTIKCGLNADVYTVLQCCTVAESRAKMCTAFFAKCCERNTAILNELASLRHERAQLLGYDTHQDFATEVSMAKNGKTVQTFLSEMSSSLQAAVASEVAELKKLKGGGEIVESDRQFYCSKIEKIKYQVDQEALKAYFPLETVTEGLLDIYEGLLGLKFERDRDCGVWNDGVTAYRATDTSSGKLVGFFYLDLFDREGKYGGGLCYNLQNGCMANDQWQYPVAGVVTSFAKPPAGEPALFAHSAVTLFFHEFGHAMHHVCSEAELNVLSGMHVESDFLPPLEPNAAHTAPL
jgi:thimet oligopeptidase